ncbi:unnamed protein product, partial [Medioppia subpectinata]
MIDLITTTMSLNWLSDQCLAYGLIMYFTRNFDYFTKQGITGPKPIPLLGNSWEQLFFNRDDLEIRRLKKYGKIFGRKQVLCKFFYNHVKRIKGLIRDKHINSIRVFEGNRTLLQVADPAVIKHILVKDFHLFTDRPLPTNARHPIGSENLSIAGGHQWRRMRSTVSPMFTSGRMRRTYPLIGHCLRQLMATLAESAATPGGGSLDVYEAYLWYAMDTIAAAAWGVETNAKLRPDEPLVHTAHQLANISGLKIVLAGLVPRPVLSALGVNTFRDDNTMNKLIELIRQLVDRRRRESRQDFISQMLTARPMTSRVTATAAGDDKSDESKSYEGHHISEGDEHSMAEKKVLTMQDRSSPLSETEIIGNSLFFFLAAYEQLGLTLAYCTMELALSPHNQQRLYDELRAVIPDANSEIAYDVLATLPFLDAVLSESMRLHASPLRLRRYAAADYRLPGTNVTVRAGQEIQIPTYAMHHMDEYYPEPNRFLPERFMPENRSKLTPYTYLPFGVGPRYCVGMRFALMEAKYALAHIVRRYRFVRCPETNVRPPQASHPILILPKSLYVGVEAQKFDLNPINNQDIHLVTLEVFLQEMHFLKTCQLAIKILDKIMSLQYGISNHSFIIINDHKMCDDLTALIVSMASFGHVMSCVAIAQSLWASGRYRRVVYAISSKWSGRLGQYCSGIEEVVVDEEYDDKTAAKVVPKWREVTEAGESVTARARVLAFATRLRLANAQRLDATIEALIVRVRPDLIVMDSLLELPSVRMAGVPVVCLWSLGPICMLDDESTPPHASGLSITGDKQLWREFRSAVRHESSQSLQAFQQYFQSRGYCQPFSDNTFVTANPMNQLNLYYTPVELDYTDCRPLPGDNYYRVDHLMPADNEVAANDFQLPAHWMSTSGTPLGKLIYLSMGTLVSDDVHTMRRLVNMLAKVAPHRVVVSMGVKHSDYTLADNMWGAEWLPQRRVIPLVDLVVSHGGCNTLCECFYHGKPIIVMPVMGNQFDFAQAIQDRGLGIRLDPYQCSEAELLAAVERLLNDNELTEKLANISQRIQSNNSLEKLPQIIDNYIEAYGSSNSMISPASRT